MAKLRLDAFLIEHEFCDSRQQAQRLIRAGEVMVNRQVIDKPGTEINVEATVEIKARPPFVSRGGEKLQKSIQKFSVSVERRICLDGGISTGGFTDCLLQNGAQKVYGVDVGYGQVAWKLRQDPRVILKERTNLRYLAPQDLYGSDQPDADFGVIDVSFISLTKVFPALWKLLAPPRDVIALIKPQFEVGREKVGKKGVVRDIKYHVEAIVNVLNSAQKVGWSSHQLTWSPLLGPAGNVEYLVLLDVTQSSEGVTRDVIEQVVDEAVSELKGKL